MATSDRLYEVACDCRDLEQSVERVKRENRDLGQLLESYRLAGLALLEELEDARLSGAYPPPAGVGKRAAELRGLIS